MAKSNLVVHFEIPTNYPDTSMDYFKQIFDWKFEKFRTEDYWFTNTGKDDQQGIDGAIIIKRDLVLTRLMWPILIKIQKRLRKLVERLLSQNMLYHIWDGTVCLPILKIVFMVFGKPIKMQRRKL